MSYINFENKKWKDKYEVTWCDQCDCYSIVCLESDCGGSTCNGHSCDKCKNDLEEFSDYKASVEDYLTKDEIDIYHKCLRLKGHILKTILNEEKEINFKKLKEEEQFSEWEEEMFKDKF